MADGSTRAIEAVLPGDWVLAYDEARHELVNGLVTQHFVHEATQALVVFNGTLVTTPEHRFYTTQGWRAAGELGPGDALLQVSLDRPEPMHSEILQSSQMVTGPITTHNLEIEGVHTYFAAGYLVHNAKQIPFEPL
jgi:hypothetical protein